MTEPLAMAVTVQERQDPRRGSTLSQILETQCHVLDLVAEELDSNPRGLIEFLEDRAEKVRERRELIREVTRSKAGE